MSSYENVKVVNLIAGEDLRSDYCEILKLEDDSDVAKVIKCTAATDIVVGILAENPTSDVTTDGLNVPVVLIAAGGKGMVKAGATITAGQLLVPDTTAGRVAGVTGYASLADDSAALGVALESAVDGDIFSALLGNFSAPHAA